MKLQDSSRQTSQRNSSSETEITHSGWDSDRQAFFSKYHASPFVSLNPLYALPASILANLDTTIPGWLTVQEKSFEHELLALCQTHHAAGIFYGQPITDSSISISSVGEASIPPTAIVSYSSRL